MPPETRIVDRLVLAWSVGGLIDAPAAALLAGRSFDPHYRESWSEGQMAGMLALPQTWLDLGHHGSELAAFALNRMVDVDSAELLLCAVAPDFRRAGIGCEMVEASCRSARSRGAQRIFLEVRVTNEPALALYKRQGFQLIGKRPGYYQTETGSSIDAITLALALN